MKYHELNVSNQENLEIIHISADGNDKAAKSWAKKEKFPFAIVLPSDKKRCGLLKFAGRGVPHYKLIDKSGNVLSTGYGASKKKIKSL